MACDHLLGNDCEERKRCEIYFSALQIEDMRTVVRSMNHINIKIEKKNFIVCARFGTILNVTLK